MAVTVHVTESVTVVGLQDSRLPPLDWIFKSMSLGRGFTVKNRYKHPSRGTVVYSIGRKRDSLAIFSAMTFSSISKSAIL